MDYLYLDDEKFVELFSRFDALFHDWGNWGAVKARKDQTDLFGESIQTGETYYKRDYGASWDATIKLSRKSLELVMFAMFAGNLILEQVADKFVEARLDYKREQMAKLPDLPIIVGDPSRSE